MIAWVLIIGLLAILLTAPAVVFGALCGLIARALVRDRKPPLRPPIL
jgi:hypothetical protein